MPIEGEQSGAWENKSEVTLSDVSDYNAFLAFVRAALHLAPSAILASCGAHLLALLRVFLRVQIQFLYTDIADATMEMIGALLAVTEKYGKEHIERCAPFSLGFPPVELMASCSLTFLSLLGLLGSSSSGRMCEYLILTRLKTPSSLYKHLRYAPLDLVTWSL
jgi:hypothetical protein